MNTGQGGNREPLIVSSRGRNPNNPFDRSTNNLEQRLEVQQDGISNTLTTFQKDNYVLEDVQALHMVRTDEGKALRKQYESGVIHHGFNEYREYEPKDDGCANTITSVQKDNAIIANYQIRKLTPKECFRLMGVKDEDYDKLTVSNTQKYKQAGNSIVVDVLMAIFENMFIKDCKSNRLF